MSVLIVAKVRLRTHGSAYKPGGRYLGRTTPTHGSRTASKPILVDELDLATAFPGVASATEGFLAWFLKHASDAEQLAVTAVEFEEVRVGKAKVKE